jgi:hypothetical protein
MATASSISKSAPLRLELGGPRLSPMPPPCSYCHSPPLLASLDADGWTPLPPAQAQDAR